MRQKNNDNLIRLDWENKDWATYLGCSAKDIPVYKKVLKKNFVSCIERDEYTGRYSFALYRYNFVQFGRKKRRLILTSENTFKAPKDAIKDANSVIIPGLRLEASWADAWKIPEKAIQMMLIREK